MKQPSHAVRLGRRAGCCGLALLACAPLLAGSRDALRFAADMARQGNWREARYRWEQVARTDPSNPRVQNNLAVAAEALGDAARAAELYAQALELSGGDPRIASNRRRFELLPRGANGALHASGGEAGTASAPQAEADPDAGAGKSRALRVLVKLPVPPRLDLAGIRTILVISFLAQETELLDTNHELVRFLRSELHKHTDLDVLEITPPPAVPEQTAEDLLANQEFWKHLGREYGADLVVSGLVLYDRRDASRFETVDVVSAATGHKVRRTEFVEQEQFQFDLDIFFMDGATGQLRHRDQLRQSVIFRGQQNDPITAFFDIAEGIAGDVLAIVSQRTREEPRFIFAS